jgi:mannosyl-3-phosphoglycerate phosphatase
MLAVFTDLDNCLLDHDTYEYAPANEALGRLRELGALVVCVTSKTRAEVEYWQARIGLGHPSVVENGGAVILEGGDAVVLGRPRAEIVGALAEAAEAAGARWRGFSMMTVDEIATRCAMPLERAVFAAGREYSEPFVLETPEREEALRAEMGARGLRLTRGGRFYHALAHEGKEGGVRWLLERECGVSIGLGDAPNDDGFLRLVDHPIKLGADGTGPAAWNRAVLAVLNRLSGRGLTVDR